MSVSKRRNKKRIQQANQNVHFKRLRIAVKYYFVFIIERILNNKLSIQADIVVEMYISDLEAVHVLA